MEKVAEVLGQIYPQFNTVSPTHTLNDALYQMCCENVDYLIVLEDRKFLGILSEQDVAKKVLLNKNSLEDIQVKDFMSSRVPVATVTDSIDHCMKLMEQHNMRYVAIFDQFEFKGIVSSHDLMKQAFLKREEAVIQENASWNY